MNRDRDLPPFDDDPRGWSARHEGAPWSALSDLDEDDHGGASDYGAPPPRQRKSWRRFMPGRWRDKPWHWFAVRIVAAMLAVFILLVAYLAVTAPLSKSLQPIATPQITLLAADGTPIARNGAMVEDPVKAAELPDHVIQPFLAIEDRRFYDHWGVDPKGIARAALTGRGGGSTITQQLAKFTFLSPERTLTRKAREALIALWLEAWLTKDEILERYLSNAYFGDNMYGLRAASLHYFYRQPEKLRPEQAAMLAGLLQAPSRLAPTQNPDLAAKRYQLVKNAMVAAEFITQAEADKMNVPPLDVRAKKDVPTGTYFADWALPEARRLVSGGYARQTITTTLDARMQEAARRAVNTAGLGGAQVALVAMRTNGEVVAMIGGKDYAKSPFNRATQAKRQPGSTFKLFVYLAALRNGWSPDDTIDGSAFTTGSYRPGNYNGRYTPTITLRDAFAQSSNVAAVRLQQAVGSDKVIETARELGVTAKLEPGDPSMALGSPTMSLLELTAAYAGVAGNAFPVEPHAFPQEETGWIDWMWSGRGSLGRRTYANMQELLRSVVTSGTGRAANLSVETFGKTGTSQENRDALFVGYAGDLVVGVWIGNDDNTPLRGVSGGGAPARIWRDFMRSALGAKAAPTPTGSPDPAGPVQPLDVPDLDDLPLGDGTRLIIRDGQAIIISEIDGVPVEGGIDSEGNVRVDVDPEAAVERARAAREAARDRAAQERAALEEAMRQRARELEQQGASP